MDSAAFEVYISFSASTVERSGAEPIGSSTARCAIVSEGDWNANASALKAFLRFFPKTYKKVDLLIKIAIDSIDPNHIRNWFAHCCYCPS